MADHSEKSGLRRRVVLNSEKDDLDDSAFQKTIKNFDIFDKYEDSIVKSNTKQGGFLSVVTICIVLFLFIQEMDYYFFQSHDEYSYGVDKSKSDGHVILTFDIIVKTPCNQIGAGVSDEAGADIRSLDDISEQPAYFDMQKDEETRYSTLAKIQSHASDEDLIFMKDAPGVVRPPDLKAPEEEENKKQTAIAHPRQQAGMQGRMQMPMMMSGPGGGLNDIFGMMMMAQQMMMNPNMMNPIGDLAKKPYNKGQGNPDSCRFFGKTTLNKVKGNLHIVHGKKISMGGGGFMSMTIISPNQKAYNFTHRINQLSFSTVDNSEIYTVQALDGHVSGHLENYFQYFLNVVGVNFADEKRKFYQFSVTETKNVVADHERSGLIFKYDFSPVLVQIKTREGSGLFMFFIRMCSIIGGVLSISSFLSKLC